MFIAVEEYETLEPTVYKFPTREAAMRVFRSIEFNPVGRRISVFDTTKENVQPFAFFVSKKLASRLPHDR